MKLSCLILFLTVYTIHNIDGQCMLDSVVINSILSDPTGEEFQYDTNNDGIVNSDDEYIELCNTAEESIVDISGWQIGDDDPPPYSDYVIPDSTFLLPGECIVLVLNYCDDGIDIDTASCVVPEGILDMNFSGTALLGNDGDVITLSDALGERACSVSYGEVMCDDLDPLDIPPFDVSNCDYWGVPNDGCALLADGDSCTYFPSVLSIDISRFEVRLADFQSVQLLWWSDSDDDLHKYIVEWSSNDAQDFSAIGTIDDSSDRGPTPTYQFVHESPTSGINYYRLKKINILGEEEYSEIRSIVIELDNEITLVPTIANDMIRINGPFDSYVISIYSISGHNFVEKKRVTNNVRINIENLFTGHYIISIFDGRSTSFERFIKL